MTEKEMRIAYQSADVVQCGNRTGRVVSAFLNKLGESRCVMEFDDGDFQVTCPRALIAVPQDERAI